MEPVDRFYNDLSAHYHLLFEDWDATVVRQGQVVDGLIARSLGAGARRILDAACGIGTQAIGLGLCGHRVTGTDLSATALARAEREAERFGVELPVRAMDMRRLSPRLRGRFEVVAVLDNALAHLLDQEGLAAAVGELAVALEPGGLFLASTRDYDRLIVERQSVTPVRVLGGGERRLLFQTWDWDDGGNGYELTQYILRHRPDGIETLAFKVRSRALTRSELESALRVAGLDAPRWLEPEETGFHQPIVAARRSSHGGNVAGAASALNHGAKDA